jgi:outer membrane protein
MRRLFFFLAVFLSVAVSHGASRAEDLPLWEAGFGFTGLSIPDYRGSDQQRGYVLPLPYLVYRGDILRLDRKGMYGLLFQSERVQFNISGDAGVPVQSGDNFARRGMPNLDTAVQIGPSIEICLSRDCETGRVVQVRLPVRAVFAVGSSRAHGIGFVANPQLNFDFTGLVFATEQYHDYYYEVAQQFAVPGVRPAYDARGGYSGSLLVLAVSKRFNRFWFGSFARYDNLSGAVFADSPLVKSKQFFMAGFGLAWVFDQSRTIVHASQ